MNVEIKTNEVYNSQTKIKDGKNKKRGTWNEVVTQNREIWTESQVSDEMRPETNEPTKQGQSEIKTPTSSHTGEQTETGPIGRSRIRVYTLTSSSIAGLDPSPLWWETLAWRLKAKRKRTEDDYFTSRALKWIRLCPGEPRWVAPRL